MRSRDALLQGLALAAGVAVDGEQAVDALVDLRQLRSLHHWFPCDAAAQLRLDGEELLTLADNAIRPLTLGRVSLIDN
ncbi:hypothetical protein VSS93_32025, partial [Pseudomonas syringae pv. tagetis]